MNEVIVALTIGFMDTCLRACSVMFSTSADAGEGSSTGATASGQQPVMFGGNS